MKRYQVLGAKKRRAPNVLFTDEKIFTVNSTCNSQNSRQLLQRGHQRSEKASVNSRSHFPSSGTVWAGLSRISYNNLDSLQVALVKSWDEISQEKLRCVNKLVQSRDHRNKF
uniref:Uncharacterized protein n=1 Tax=Heterorhabditis bacteriophora TaxID=37862 RepID=A0A1I7WNS6_HETBA